MVNIVEGILSRNAQGKLDLPAPTIDELDTAFSCALRAPDHQVLRPWRYLVIEGAALTKLGDLFVAAAHLSEPDINAERIEKLQKMPLRAPMIVVALTVHKEDAKVPREEQVLSTGAAIQNFILGLHAKGFTSMWRTGPLAEDATVKKGLGLAANESIAGFIYIGTAKSDAKKITYLPVSDFVTTWQG
jgi:nitroreductase